MFAALVRRLLRLRRPAGLGLAAAVPTLLLIGLFWYETAPRAPDKFLKTAPLEVLLQRGEAAAGDLLSNHGRHTALRSDMVFIGLDDASLSLDGLWPDEITASPALQLISEGKGAWNWSREVHALLLDRLTAAGARLVIFDMVFPNPNTGDEAFRAALDRHRDRVVVASQFVKASRGNTFQAPAATLVTNQTNDPRVGYATYLADFDGVIRELSFGMTLAGFSHNAPQPDDPLYSSLLASSLRQLGQASLIPADGQARRFRYTDLRIDGETHIPRADYPAHPLWEVFSDATWKQNYQDGAFFRDKIVIVGAAANTLHDFQNTPFGDIAGPDIHLQALTAALGGEYLTRTRRGVDFLLILAAGGLAWVVGLAVRSPLIRLGMFIAVCAAFCGLLLWLYNRFGLMPLAFTPLLCFNVGGLGGLVGEYAVERAEKARVRGVLDRLVSKDIVRELLADRDRYAQIVRGQRRCVTVLFSDVRGFTTLSENAADPAAFVAQLNEYLGDMVDVVFKYRGTLDKFIGDSVMAVWGSMHTEGDAVDACGAVAAALEMRERLAALNARWTANGQQTLAVGIGLNYGEVIVGGLGSEKSKMEISVIGDAVNSASRFEGLTKEYGLDLLVGENVAERVSETFRLRTVDRVRVKGKNKPTEVMTVLGPLTEIPSEEREIMLADYEDAILLYRRREFTAAADLLETCRRVAPDDKLVQLYLTRCHELLADAPASGWDGVRLMTTK